MSTRSQTRLEAPSRETPSLALARTSLLQRKCACGGSGGAGLTGECEDCKKKRFPLQQSAASLETRSAATSDLQQMSIFGGFQAGFQVSQPGDPCEQDADRVAEQVMRMPATLPRGFPSARGEAQALHMAGLSPARGGNRVKVQSKAVSGQGGQLTPGLEAEMDTRQGPGLALSASVRAFFEPRFGHDFSQVRIHTDSRAAESACALDALAYTVGRDIVFATGQYSPETPSGQRLLAHELAHTLQQEPGHAEPRMVMRRWDEARGVCPTEPAGRWIQKVVVQQETPQTVTAHWSDGRQESDECSSGKGHCCVDPAAPEHIACTVRGSRVEGSNCTPLSEGPGFPIRHRDLDHRGISFWSEFVPEPRYIALHTYSPVDGTPLSHGCVRLNESMAKTIFCGVRQNRTHVEVRGFARPSCEQGSLRREWEKDFRAGGRDISQLDGDRDAMASLRETHRMLKATFGRELTVDEIRALSADQIPRCSGRAPLPPGARVGMPTSALPWILGLGAAGLAAGLLIGAAFGGWGLLIGGLVGAAAGAGLGYLIGR